ncbi:MAG: IPT/TIG domain-containing protein [Bacteroidota bacterium]
MLRNLVHSVSSSSTGTPIITGMQVNAGFMTIANNMIRLGLDTAAALYSNASTIRGIWHQSSTQSFYYHNSVFMAGSPATGAAITSAFESSAQILSGQQMDIRNNIFANTISNGAATGFNFGLRLQDSLRITSNYNIINTPGTGGFASGIAATNTRYALLGGDSMSWKAITGLDAASSAASPNFSASATAISPNVELSLQGSNPAERSGDPTVTTVATDYYNNSRASNTPSDIGAHAGNFTMAPDAFAPVISYVPLTNAGSLTGIRTLNNVVITDNNGIVMSGANRPKLYYSRDGITWFSSSAVTVTGTATNSTASFNIDYLVFSPTLTLSDTIRYYVVAQDAAANVGSFPLLAVGTDVNTITQNPRTPSRYSFLPVIPANTVLQVGTGQTYTSLTNAGGLFEFLNSRTLGGNIVAEITSDLTAETGAIALNRFAEDGVGAGTFTLTIRPNASTTTPRLIEGSYLNTVNNYGLITLIGADRVKITGIPTGGTASQRMLRIRNTAATGAYNVGTGNSVITVSSATGVAIRNCIIESGNSNTAGGAIEFRAGLNNQFINTPCSFDTLTNCVLTNNTIATLPDGIPANAGVYSFGNPNVYNNNIVITNNEISNCVVAGIGVVTNNGDGFVISGNSIFYNLGFVPNYLGQFQGIVFLPGSFASGHNITNNFIGGTAANCGGSALVNPNNMGFIGIRTQVGNGANTLIGNNTVRNISFTNSAATYQFQGISAQAGNTVISNNIIGDPVVANGINWAPSASVFGIVYSGVNNIQIQNNTVQGINISTPNTSAQFVGIQLSGGTITAPISGNTIGHATNTNSVVAAGNTLHYGMLISPLIANTPSYTLSNNTIANITATGTGTSGILYGAQIQNSAFPTITGNAIRELRSASISNSTNGVAVGLLVTVGSSTVATVTNNQISAIRATNTGNSPTIVHGILQTAGQDNVYNRNRIWDITNASTSVNLYPAPIAAGISIGGASTTANLYNNQITLGNGFANNIQLNGIYLYSSNTTLTLNAINNSVLIDGTAGAGPQNTYAFLRGNNTGTEISTNMALRNNILANRRTGGTGNHYAISNQASSPTNGFWNSTTSVYNLMATSNSNTVGEWGLTPNNLANWRANATSDVIGYYLQAGTGAGQLNLNNLFTSPAVGNLGLITTNQEVWYVYGKGITGASANNLNNDFAGNARSTSQGTATTIGSVHMTSAPSMLPIAAVASAAPAASTTTSYTFASMPVASIAWGASAPTSATVYDFTGVNPPASPAGNFNNRYVRTDVSGGTPPYNYALTYNFNEANLGNMQNANNLRLATSNLATPTSWTTQFTTTSNSSTRIATVSGISTTGTSITFTGTELTAPATISAFVPSAREIGGAVSIRGSLFTGATAVSFNGTAQPTFTVVNDTTITTTVPTGATTGPVSVTNPFGTGTSSGNFTVIPAPTVTGLSATSGTFGTAVTITGTGFTWASQVQFNTTNATGFVIVNNTTITCTVPNGSTSGVVTVTNPAGSASSSATFTVFPVPSITSFTPTSGPIGTSVTITGTEFNAITAVRFNGINSSYTVNSATSITATVPGGATTGTISVVNGSGTGTSASSFTVTTPPSITGFSPTAGGVGTSVTISGSNFTGATAVTFNGVTSTFTVVNSTTITATVPASATTGVIAVTTASGTTNSSSTFTVYVDLVVSTNTGVSGTYNNITVTGTGTANLTGSLLALGNVTVQSGGVMDFGTNVLNGNGNFTANGGSRIVTGSADGLSATGGISGSVQMNGTRTFSGRVEYNGSVAQITGNSISGVDSLIINNTNGVTLSAARALNWVNLQSGWLALGNNNLTINNNGAITGFNSSNWIRTNGTGTLRRNVQNNNTPVLFPIGSDGYTPVQVTFTLASTTDVVGARVFSGVLANGTAGSNLSSSMVNRSWVIDETVAGGSTATVSLQWADTMEIGGFNRTNCGVSFYRSTPPSWMAPATYGPATGSNPFTVTRSGVALSTTPTAFAVGDNLANSTLPVQLTKLVANKAGEDVIVNWSTASEFNNSHFEVERSFNGADFELAGKVDGVGFTNSESNYNFVDEKAALNPTAQVIYYRLKQVDFDGKHTFYGPVAVNINKLVANVNVSVYPNPFNQQVNVQVVSPEAGTMQISITDLQGRAVYTGTHEVNKGLQVISLDGIDTLKDGVYFMNSNINGSVSRVKLVKAGN